MTQVATRVIPLNWAVFVKANGTVLVDAFPTIEQARVLGDWVAASGKNLTTIYVTHGHGTDFALR